MLGTCDLPDPMGLEVSVVEKVTLWEAPQALEQGRAASSREGLLVATGRGRTRAPDQGPSSDHLP